MYYANLLSTNVKPQVDILPLYMSLLDKDPVTFLSTVAHELGHQIDPKRSQYMDTIWHQSIRNS